MSGGIESAPSVPSIIKPARSKDAYKWQLLDWGRDTFDSSGSEATLIAAGGAGGAKIGSVITAALSGGAALAEGAAEGAAGGAVVGPWGALAGAAIGAAVTAGGIYLAKDMAAEYEDTHRFNVASDKDSIIASAAKFMKDNGIL